MKERNQIILTFVVSATVGVIAGLLFAPYKGSVIRRKISDASIHLTEDLIHKAEEGICAIQDLTENFYLKKDIKN
jgi:gas vesicle protein